MKIINTKAYNLYSQQQINPEFKGGINKRMLVNNAIVCDGAIGVAANAAGVITGNPELFLLSEFAKYSIVLLTMIKHKFVEKPLNLEPNIEFKKAQTLKEAENFAKEKFKLKTFQVDDLEIANWINEGLTVLNNKCKGEVYMPSKIIYGDISNKKTQAYYRQFNDTLKINRIDEDELDKTFNYMSLSSKSLLELPLGKGHEEFWEKLNNYKNLSKIEKFEFLSSFANVLQIIPKIIKSKRPNAKDIINLANDINPFGPAYLNRFCLIFHEMGHVFDYKSRNDYGIIKSFLFKKAVKKLILPNYTASCFTEFNADIFAGIFSGERYSDEIMKLFKRLNNIKLPNN